MTADTHQSDWQARAACTSIPLLPHTPSAHRSNNIFFPAQGQSTDPAKQICAGCPVQPQCLEYALSNSEKFGIWGGTSERERRTLRRARTQTAGNLRAV